MLLNELPVTLQLLPKAQKLRLIQLLAADLARDDEISVGDEGKSIAIWSPFDAFHGADTLLRAERYDSRIVMQTPQRFQYVQANQA